MILSIPFCPHHFVRYHFVLEPILCHLAKSSTQRPAVNNYFYESKSKFLVTLLQEHSKKEFRERSLTVAFLTDNFCEQATNPGSLQLASFKPVSEQEFRDSSTKAMFMLLKCT